MMKKTIFSLTLAALFSISCHSASADLHVTVQEEGSNVVVDSAGTVDLSGLTPIADLPLFASLVPDSPSAGQPAAVLTGPLGIPDVDFYDAGPITPSEPDLFGAAIQSQPQSGTGNWHGFSLAGTVFPPKAIVVPAGYVSGAPLVSRMQFDNKTVAGLGLNPGRYQWLYGGNTITLDIFSEFVLGDSNLDGEANFLDISPFIAALSSGTYLAQADCNQDGVLDFLDISPFIIILSQ